MSTSAMRNFVSKMMMPLRNRVYTMITRAVLETADDTDGMQVVKVNLLAGEARDGVERFQNFGFSSNPPEGAECVAVSVGGNRDHLIIIVADDRKTRVKNLAKGESVQYNSKGDKWHLKADGTLEGRLSKNLDVVFQKLKLSNGTDELVDLLVQTMDALLVEPFIVNKATFTLIKAKLEAFKI